MKDTQGGNYEAREAREAQAMVGHPTDRDFLGMVRANMILNCPIKDTAVINVTVSLALISQE